MRNLQVRRTIFYGFILIFLVSAPAIVLFTAGFRWSVGQGITRTGTIFVASIPKDASVYVEDILYPDTTPTVVKRQTPGVWDVRLELEDHFSWEKNLEVFEGTTTFIDNVILFLDTEPTLLIPEDMSNVSWSPDRKSIAWADHQVGWTEIWVSSVERPASSLVSRFTLNKAVDLTWINNYVLSITNDEVETLVGRDGVSVELAVPEPERTEIEIVNSSAHIIDTSTNDVIARLPFGTYTVIDERGPYIIVKDSLNSQIGLITRNDRNEPLLLLEHATSAEWIREDVLLFASPFSISIYEPSKHETTLITRISSEIRDPQWHPDGGYIFYATGNELRVVELDDRDGRRDTVLAELEDITSFAVDSRGRTLYIVGDNSIDKGLFSRPLYKR
ncbi:PD40 domain-containing protein [Candidatus Uhrbacteria bacterium]|nr:PD40 domain-containing protein [Candidatus Uhrbacteria bacterium]